jgi:Carboxypeptidase regulatory-like domain
MHMRWVVGLWATALLVPLGAFQQPIQQNTGISGPQSSSSAEPQSSSSKNGQSKYSHANDFLLRGTVFTEKALAFPGAELRIRRSGKKKFRWQDSTNSRGEFAIRVPQGTQYEVVVRAKGFAEQVRTIDARNGSGENNIVFRMEPAKKGKP